MSPHYCYALTRGHLVRIWCPSEFQAKGLAASYRKLYPNDSDAWIEEVDEGSGPNF